MRQIRLRDLGGIIVVDFIDMDERKNRQKVMQALEEAMRADRAPYKILQFNDFGLVAITRKRVKQILERTLCVAVPVLRRRRLCEERADRGRRDSAWKRSKIARSGGRQRRDAARQPGSGQGAEVAIRTRTCRRSKRSSADGAGEERSAAAPGEVRPGVGRLNLAAMKLSLRFCPTCALAGGGLSQRL